MLAALAVVLWSTGVSPVVIDVAHSTPVIEYNEPRSARVDARGATRIVIYAKAGWLRVNGQPNATEVVAEGTAVAPRESMLRDITLTGTREGDVVRIVVDIPDLSNRWNDDWDRGPALDLSVTVPSHIPIEIDDTSGDLRVVGTGALDLNDNSGDVELRDIGGELRVEDGSGELQIESVRGAVTIDDGSGEIDISDVTGSVTIDDGSGSISVRRISGTMLVRRDGSGGIRAFDIGGNLEVDRSRDKGIEYSGVKGQVLLRGGRVKG
jgi:DUF4097 and DUF4098 domain-containing protein YvlB